MNDRNCYWERDGVKHNVKNLGWLLKHASEATDIYIQPLAGGRAELIVYLDDFKTYVSTFESLEVCKQWVKRPSLSHIKARVLL